MFKRVTSAGDRRAGATLAALVTRVQPHREPTLSPTEEISPAKGPHSQRRRACRLRHLHGYAHHRPAQRTAATLIAIQTLSYTRRRVSSTRAVSGTLSDFSNSSPRGRCSHRRPSVVPLHRPRADHSGAKGYDHNHSGSATPRHSHTLGAAWGESRPSNSATTKPTTKATM